LKIRPPSRVGIHIATVVRRAGHPETFALSAREAPKTKPMLSIEESTPAATVRRSAPTDWARETERDDDFPWARSLLIDAAAHSTKLTANRPSPPSNPMRCFMLKCTAPIKTGPRLPRKTTIPLIIALVIAIPNRVRLTPKSKDPRPHKAPNPTSLSDKPGSLTKRRAIAPWLNAHASPTGSKAIAQKE